MTKFIIVLAMILCLFPAAAWTVEITQDLIDEQIVSYIRNHAPAGVEMVKWNFRHGNPLPLKGKIVELERTVHSDWKARTSIRIKIETAGREQIFWLSLHLAYSREVIVARHNLVIGHRIDRQDILLETRAGWKYMENCYLPMDEVLGKGIGRPVSKGTCLKNFHISHNKAMKRGAAVVILAEKGNLRVEAPGKVLETGSPGEMVKVLNTLSGKEVYATVLDNSTVSVSF